MRCAVERNVQPCSVVSGSRGTAAGQRLSQPMAGRAQRGMPMKTIHRMALAGVLLATGLVLGCAGRDGSATRALVERKANESQEAPKPPRTLIGLQYESLFTKHNVSWEGNQPSGSVGLYNGTAEAVPILGKYNSDDVSLIKKHEEWFEYLGIDWLLIDWTNFIIAKPAWELHQGATRDVEDTTELIFKTYSQLQKEGKHPPRLVFMMPLFSSDPHPQVGIQRLNHIIQWATPKFLDNPQYKNLLLNLDGKPLMMVPWWSASVNKPGSTCEDLAKFTSQVVAPGWTVRWMGTQLQNSHADRCGYWSWMDGTIRQAVTFRNGVPEETVVTPACFPFAFAHAPDQSKFQGGWLDPRATGRDHGAPYLESWKVAFENHPEFIQIHQWNEFSGQPKGKGMGPGATRNVYGDEYNLEFSDDLEPTKLDGCGYRGCGGWGYYYMNLTKALISLYRQETPGITVLALSGPIPSAVVKKGGLPLTWNYLGEPPGSYTLQVDGQTVATDLHGESYTLNLSKFSPGKHTVSLIANGVHTYFDLNPERLTQQSSTPLPVTSAIEFDYAPAAQRK
jgi:hypothetical protein